jgi:flavin-dependent dehydrogenase
MMSKTIQADVAIIGGGPAGSTVGTLLRKYAPDLRVTILEREHFPREHVGESQLPPLNTILQEMGCWDAVEAADFPIKIGGTYRWGQDPHLWDFEFLPLSEVVSEPRPAAYAGWRTKTAFQVDRAIYDKILLDRAAELGCDVRQRARVTRVRSEGDRVEGLVLEDGYEVEARHYVDATGSSGFMRRAMGVEANVSPSLKNVAMWDYWTNAQWAIEIGVGGTRIQILSLPYGWMWFIPLGPTRTSIGLVTPADYLRESGMRPEALYEQALRDEPRIRELIAGGEREGRVRTTKDWSFVAERCTGENWYLAGESAGFADPILSAGMTISQMGARELAYTLLEIERESHPREWLCRTYEEQQRNRVLQHIRFADFWYTQNGCFTDLKDATARLARESGYEMDANEAFRWFASGSFSTDTAASAVANHAIGTAKYLAQLMSGQTLHWEVARYSRFYPSLEGATQTSVADYAEGRISVLRAFQRGGKTLKLNNLNELIFQGLSVSPKATEMMNAIANHLGQYMSVEEGRERIYRVIEAMEGLLLEGWLRGEAIAGEPRINMVTPTVPGPLIHPNEDPMPAPKRPTEDFLRPRIVHAS